MDGYIHSFESMGAVDGPGIRFVVFLQGCPLRCLYCHNPDTWDMSKAKIIMPPEIVMRKIMEYKSFINGVTLSGGEPLAQTNFCEKLISLCKANSLHTAIDTSGAIEISKTSKVISLCSLLILDIKDVDYDGCKELTGAGNNNAIATLDYCEIISKPVWIRQVILPQYTLQDKKLHSLGNLLSKYRCVERIELLPYHNMGLAKWSELGLKSKIAETVPPTENDVEKARNILRSFPKLKKKVF